MANFVFVSKVFFGFLFVLSSNLFLSTQSLSVDVKPHPEDLVSSNKNVNQEMERTVATPFRLTEDLTEISTSNHYRSRHDPADSHFTNPIYKLNVFGQNLLLRLKLDDDLIAPSYTTSLSSEKTIRNRTEYTNKALMRNCFYDGKVVGHPNSQVGVSICGSITGSFSTEEHQYFIEPFQVRSSNGDSVPHSIRRRSIGIKNRENDNGEPSTCGVNEARNRRTYRRTFKRDVFKQLVHKVCSCICH